MANTAQRLGDLVNAAREGVAFYEYAASQVELVSMSFIFRNMALVRADLVKELSPEVPAYPSCTQERESANRLYRRMRPALCSIPAQERIAELVRHEAAFIDGLGEISRAHRDNPLRARAAEALRVQLSRMRTCQAELERQQASLAILRDALVSAEATINEPVPDKWRQGLAAWTDPQAVEKGHEP